MLELILTLLVLGLVFLLFFAIRAGVTVTIVHKYQYENAPVTPTAGTAPMQTTKDVEEQNAASLDPLIKGISEMLGVELNDE